MRPAHSPPEHSLSAHRPAARARPVGRALVALALAQGLALGTPALASGQSAPAEDLDELSLEQLMQVEVTSVSGKAETLRSAAAAVYVLDRDDLRRTGATSVPDALRQVPGLMVARIDATKWAVTARGFNGRFANKLLVLLDGRRVYSPYFAGVLWDEQHVPFDLIERIEIVRGPGATIWGANAVNGVINIITRDAGATTGTEVEVGGGNRGSYTGYARHAERIDDTLALRAFASALAADPTDPAIGDDTDDAWRDMQFGTRLDWTPGEQDDLTLQLQARHGNSNENLRVAALAPLRVLELHGNVDSRGGFVTGRWSHRFSGGSDLDVHVQHDRAERRNEFFEYESRSYEAGARYRLQPWTAHDIVLGASYRYADVPLQAGHNSTLQFFGDTSMESIAVFAQDEIALSERLSLIIGSKLEHTESTGWEPQPNIRMSWQTDAGTFWGAVSRAVRTPSQGESEFGRILVPFVLAAGTPGNPSPLPVGASVVSNRDLDAERLLAMELGWRGNLTGTVSASVSLYRHAYDDLVQARILGVTCEPSGIQVAISPVCLFSSSHLLTRTDVVNTGDAEEVGLEIDLAWQASDNLRIAAQATWRDLDEGGNGPAAVATFAPAYGPGDPQWLASAQLSWQPVAAIEVDLGVRLVDDVKKHGIDAYTTADIRLAWRAAPAINVELLGTNLLQARHREYASELGDTGAARIERTALARITWTR